jgi:hypothetical protein
MFLRPVQIFLLTRLVSWWRKHKFACVCFASPSWFNSSNSSERTSLRVCDPLATVQFQLKLALQAGFHVPWEFHKNLKFFKGNILVTLSSAFWSPKASGIGRSWVDQRSLLHTIVGCSRCTRIVNWSPNPWIFMNPTKSSRRACQLDARSRAWPKQNEFTKKLNRSQKHQGGKVVCNE